MKSHNLFSKIDKVPEGYTIHGGDTSPMSGIRGMVRLEVCLEDSNSKRTKFVLHRFVVYDRLNHPVIIGRDLIKRVATSYFTCPEFDQILLNPSIKNIRSLSSKIHQKSVNKHQKLSQNSLQKASLEKRPTGGAALF